MNKHETITMLGVRVEWNTTADGTLIDFRVEKYDAEQGRLVLIKRVG
jgi:hypothetical protein